MLLGGSVKFTTGEYDEKMAIYTRLGVLYYVIYNPEFWRRDQHQPLEVYKLVDGNYQLQIGEPCWMPEVGLGIGRYQGVVAGISQELLSWYNQRGDRYLSAEEQVQQERSRAKQLAEYLRSLGIDPDNLPSKQS
ncbi:MAG: hypothetical protein ACR2LR_08595 [Hassallia sp.]